MVEWLSDRIGRLTLIIFSHLSGLNFALGASYGFEPTFFGQAAGALVVLVMGFYKQ